MKKNVTWPPADCAVRYPAIFSDQQRLVLRWRPGSGDAETVGWGIPKHHAEVAVQLSEIIPALSHTGLPEADIRLAEDAALAALSELVSPVAHIEVLHRAVLILKGIAASVVLGEHSETQEGAREWALAVIRRLSAWRPHREE